MALNNDYVFRVIVEGDDFLSQVTNRAATNYEKDTNRIRSSSRALKKELDELEKSAINFDRAINKSRATSPRQFSRIFGVPVSQSEADRLVKIRQFRQGQISRAKHGDFAVSQFLGIDVGDIDRFEKELDATFKIANRAQSGYFQRVEKLQRATRQKIDDLEPGARRLRKPPRKTGEREFKSAITDLLGYPQDFDRVLEDVKGIANRRAAATKKLIVDSRRTLADLGVTAKVASEVEGLRRIGDRTRSGAFRQSFLSGLTGPEQLALPAAGQTGFGRLTTENVVENIVSGRQGTVATSGISRGFVAGPGAVTRRGETEADRDIRRVQRLIDLEKRFKNASADVAVVLDKVNDRLAEAAKVAEGAGKKFGFLRSAVSNFFSGITNESRLPQLEQDLAKVERNLQQAGEQFRKFHIRTVSRARNRASGLFTPEEERQFLSGRANIASLSREAQRLGREIDGLNNIFYKAGSAIRRFVRDANSLVRVRWLLLVTFITILAKAIISLGAALVEIGASAIQAGAALGGAFVAGVSQAIAVVGLLQAAMSRVKAVFNLVQQQEKLNIRSSTDTKAQIQAEQSAQEQLTSAIQGRKDALIDLAKARKQAARDIVDAALHEKDANLSVIEATQGLYDAKKRLADLEKQQSQDKGTLRDLQDELRAAQQRLALAQQQGQEVEAAAAAHQVAIAQQNLNNFKNQQTTTAQDIKEQKTSIQRAQLTLQQARIEQKRAHEDNQKAKKQGVNGDDQVVQALRRVRDATKQVADAQQALAEATAKQTTAQAVLQDQLNNLSGSERLLFKSLLDFREKARLVFRPITDIIVQSIGRGVDRASGLLSNGTLINAARGLALEMGKSIDRISKFVVSPRVTNDLAFFIRQARANLPTITTAFLNLFKAFLNVARAGAPLFRQLLERFTKFTGSIEKLTANKSKMDHFFNAAAKSLDSWIKLGKAIGDVIIALTKTAGPSGTTLVDHIAQALERMAKFLNENQKIAKEFFETQRKNIEQFAGTLFTLGKALFTAFSSSQLDKFIQLIADILIPSFQLSLEILNKIAAILLDISKIPGAKPILQFAFAVGILTRFFPILQNFDKIIFDLLTKKAVRDRLRTIFEQWGTQLNKLRPAAEAVSSVLNRKLIPAIIKTAIEARAATATMLGLDAALLVNPYVIAAVAILAVIAALVALELKFHFIEKTAAAVEDVFRSLARFFTTYWKTVVLAAILYPFAGIIFAIRFRDKLLGVARSIVDYFRNNWKSALKSFIPAPFNPLFIRNWGDTVLSIITNVADGIGKAFRNLPQTLSGIFSGLFSGRFSEQAQRFGRDLVDGVIEGIRSKGEDLKNWFYRVIMGAVDFVKDALGIKSPSEVTKQTIGVPISEGVREGAMEGLRGFGSEYGLTLQRELAISSKALDTFKNKALSSLQDFKFLATQQINAAFDVETPASREIARIQAQEDKRNRQQQVNQANQAVADAKTQVKKTGNEVTKARKALREADNKAERDAAKSRLQAALQEADAAKKNLKAQQDQQAETLHQAAVAQRIDYLTQLDIQQRKAIEKRRSQALAEADTLFNALVKALNAKDFTKAQKIMNKIVDLPGMHGLGVNAATQFVEGFEKGLKGLEGVINKGIKQSTKQASIKAQQEKTAKGILQTTPETAAAAAALGPGPHRGTAAPSAVEQLKTLIALGQIDKQTAIAIVKILSQVQAREVVGLLSSPQFMPSGDDIAVRDALRHYSKGNKNISYKEQLVKLLRDGKLNYGAEIVTEDEFLKDFSKALSTIQLFQSGGEVGPSSDLFSGAAVPAIVHVGEWVLNKKQQAKLAQRFGTTASEIKDWLFGPVNPPNRGQQPGQHPGPAKGKTTSRSRYRNNYSGQYYDLVSKEDDYGATVWFVEFDDGSYGTVSPKSAARIISSDGHWFPRGIINSIHGFTAKGQEFRARIEGRYNQLPRSGPRHKFALGGVVTAAAKPFMNMKVNSYAAGGVVTASPSGVRNSDSVAKTVNQNFNVTTQGETDWNYVMRLGAIHALG